MPSSIKLFRPVALAGLAAGLWCLAARAEVLTLKNGLTLEGRVSKIASLGLNLRTAAAAPGEVKNELIVIVDDELRRTYVSTYQIANAGGKSATGEVRIDIPQRVAEAGLRVSSVGPLVKSTPFDEWGRRTVTFQTPQGPVDVIQGITEITPKYCRVQGLLGQRAYLWDMRIATSSLPQETLSRILLRRSDPKNSEDRLNVARLYIQAERYQDARLELEGIVRDFPQLAELGQQVQALRPLGAERLLREVKFRRGAAQHGLARTMLEKFPTDDVAGETLQKVKELLDEYAQQKDQGEKALKLMAGHLAEIEQSVLRGKFEEAVNEIAAELNLSTLERLADYMRLADSDTLRSDQKLALATSGWILGGGAATENPSVALSLYETRKLVVKYLLSSRKAERDTLLADLTTQEGSAPQYLSKLLAQMKPAHPLPQADEKNAGLYSLSVPGLEGEDVPYLVQLPPEYDPYRKYPCVVTLHGSFTSPQQQLDWWAGVQDEKLGMRIGQATRQGYIVIAPGWARAHQSAYEYSAREHAAVTSSLRDACRRFAIDTDRVFLSGHSMGGDAAWDLAVSHPDLWAGVIAVNASARKYVDHYLPNARYVPFYLIGGELDGDRMRENARNLDRYMNTPGYESLVVEYRGRGHEHFQDEITRVFDWMRVHTRNFAVKQFKCVSLRPWDNYFWCVELSNFPERAMVQPVEWPTGAGASPKNVSGLNTEVRVAPNNRITLTTGAGTTTVWLSPEFLNLAERATITVNGGSKSGTFAPSIATMLEDVRTRGDRQHPFWTKVEFGGEKK